ncbi:hypothetical protein ACFO4L_15560 [Bacillus daqingensis]|uniref:Uncharacterized protein n=1 Tax=Bacillus daqingensis TaxID=872396 RepID=A0ABV9P009_9BACI
MSEQRAEALTEEQEETPLPSRRDRHSSRSAPRKRKKKKKKTGNVQFPLVRIWLVLFFTIVAAMFTYPVWIEQIR